MGNVEAYQTFSDNRLKEICTERGIEFDPYVRADVVVTLRAWDGATEQSMKETVDELNEIAEVDPDRIVKIEIHNQADDPMPYVFVGHNGRCWNIPKGVIVPVLKEIVTVLNDAVEIRTQQEIDPKSGRFVMVERPVKRFNFTIHP